MSDDSVSLADTMSMGGDWSEDRIRIPGPSEGEYLMRVKHKPGQDVLLMVDYIGIRESGSSDVMGLTSSADSVSTYRLRLDLAAETPVQIESLHPGDSVATRAARVQLRLPCEPDSFDSIPAANASIELLCKGTPTLTVTMPDGDNSYSVGPVWTEGGKHVTSAYSPHPTIGFVGARRDRYLVAVKATVTGMHVVTVSRTLPGGATFTRADSMSIPAGDTRYWHTSWSEARQAAQSMDPARTRPGAQSADRGRFIDHLVRRRRARGVHRRAKARVRARERAVAHGSHDRTAHPPGSVS